MSTESVTTRILSAGGRDKEIDDLWSLYVEKHKTNENRIYCICIVYALWLVANTYTIIKTLSVD